MIAVETFAFVKLTYAITSSLWLSPIAFDSESYKFVMKATRIPMLGIHYWKVVAYSMSACLAAIPSVFLGVAVFGSPSTAEVLSSICLVCILAIPALIQHFLCTESENAVKHMNNLLQLNKKFRKNSTQEITSTVYFNFRVMLTEEKFHVKTPQRDGLEKLFMVMYGCVLISPLVELPGFIIVFSQGWEVIKFVRWMSNLFGLHISIAIASGVLFCTLLWIQVLTFFTACIFIQVSPNRWLRMRNKA